MVITAAAWGALDACVHDRETLSSWLNKGSVAGWVWAWLAPLWLRVVLCGVGPGHQWGPQLVRAICHEVPSGRVFRIVEQWWIERAAKGGEVP